MNNREEWLEEKRTCIGASEVADILGYGRGTALGVYLKKVKGYTNEDSRIMRFGRWNEQFVADEYTDETGRPVEDLGATTIIRHPDIDWIGVTLDRTTEYTVDCPGPECVLLIDKPVPLELKTVQDPTVSRKLWSTDPPIKHQIQNQTQMFATGAQWGSLAGLFFPGCHLEYCDLKFSQAFFDEALPRLEDFWRRVKTQRPPEPTTHKDLAPMKALYSETNGETVLLDSAETRKIVELWNLAKVARNDAEEDVEKWGAQLRSRMGENEFGALDDGSMLKLSTVKRDGYTVKPTSYRQLRLIQPKG